jgi:hypothetical protein
MIRVVTWRDPDGRASLLFYEGKLEGRATAFCLEEGWFERYALEDDPDGEPRTLPGPNGGVIFNRGRAGGMKVRNGELVTERIYGPYFVRNRITGSRTYVEP